MGKEGWNEGRKKVKSGKEGVNGIRKRGPKDGT